MFDYIMPAQKPRQRGQADKRSVRNLNTRGLLAPDHLPEYDRQACCTPQERGHHEDANHGLPSEQSADCGHQVYIAKAHRLFTEDIPAQR